MVAYDDREDQEEVGSISWRFMILTAKRERTGDRLNGDILYIVCLRLPRPEVYGVQGVEDTEEKKKERYHYVNNVSESLLLESSF